MISSVTVVIVNWNSGDLLGSCLAHLKAQTVQPDGVIVIDNGSQDGSATALPTLTGVRVEYNGENLGFAAANNRALVACKTEFVALLNPDAFPEPDWLEKLLDAVVRHPEAAAFGSRQLDHVRPDTLDGIGDIYHWSGAAWRGGYRDKFQDRHLQTREIFSPCAAAALYRREALIKVGGFDESYFCYMEDVDLGFRLRLAGYSARYVADAVVRHVGSATTGGQNSDFSVYHGHRNLVWTFVKDMPGNLFWLLLPMHLALNIGTLIWFAAQGKGAVIWRAKRDAVRGLPTVWRKRKGVQGQRSASISSIWQTLDKRMLVFHLLAKRFAVVRGRLLGG